MLTLDIIIIILLAFILGSSLTLSLFWYIYEKEIIGVILFFSACLIVELILYTNSVLSEPTAIDVYNKKTELKINGYYTDTVFVSKDTVFVPTDSTVVFK